MKSIARVRFMFLCIFLLSTCCFYLFRQRDDDDDDGDFKEESKHSFGQGDDDYVRDHRGYLYHKEYFQSLPTPQTNLFTNISVLGRHSDTVLPPCRDPNGVRPDSINVHYRMTGPFDYLDNFKNPCWLGGDQLANETVRCIPYYYVIGTPKAGSSDLFSRIRMHPHVAPISKEHRWFDTYRFAREDNQDITRYVRLFSKSAGVIQRSATDAGYHYKIVGDGSPSYLFNNERWTSLPGNEWCLEPRVLTVSYIHNLFPRAKLILIVRNPVERLYSDYLFNSKRTGANKTAEEFHAWAKTTIENYRNCFRKMPFRYCLYSRKLKYESLVHSFAASIYSRLLLDALRIFPRNQILVLQMEDYSVNMVQKLQEVFDFLGIDRLSTHRMQDITQIKQYNVGKHYQKAGPMLPVTRKMIYDFYRPFNEELAQMLNDDKYLWLEK